MSKYKIVRAILFYNSKKVNVQKWEIKYDRICDHKMPNEGISVTQENVRKRVFRERKKSACVTICSTVWSR